MATQGEQAVAPKAAGSAPPPATAAMPELMALTPSVRNMVLEKSGKAFGSNRPNEEQARLVSRSKGFTKLKADIEAVTAADSNNFDEGFGCTIDLAEALLANDITDTLNSASWLDAAEPGLTVSEKVHILSDLEEPDIQIPTPIKVNPPVSESANAAVEGGFNSNAFVLKSLMPRAIRYMAADVVMTWGTFKTTFTKLGVERQG
eukprot:6466826-Amphidinium_carterae.1